MRPRFIARLLQRHRWIAYVGLAIILYVALSMIWEGSFEIHDAIALGPDLPAGAGLAFWRCFARQRRASRGQPCSNLPPLRAAEGELLGSAAVEHVGEHQAA